MSMDSFGFDFAGGDILDLGSLGMWGGSSTPMGSSPNGGAGAGAGGLPFSVGTPTGVQSLGDDPFAGLSAGGPDDLGFGDSPKLDRKDDLAGPYFGAELEPGASSSAVTAPTTATATATSAATNAVAPAASGADDKAKTVVKTEAGGKKEAPTPGPAKPAPSPGAAPRGSSAPASTPSSAAAASTTSAARPHLGPSGPTPSPSQPSSQSQAQQQQQQQQQQQRYQMMMNQQAQAPPGGFPGAPPPQQQPQGGYMHAHMGGGAAFMGGGPPPGQPQPQGYARPPASAYEEEFLRVKAMMMQHPDLIPPPMEVLRISMSQSSAQGAMGSYMQQQQARAGQMAAMNRAYGAGPYGGMMMAQPQNPGAVMMNPAAARMNPQMNARQPQQPPQQRTPGSATAGGASSGPGSDAPTAWQSENDLPLRRKMIGKMYVTLSPP